MIINRELQTIIIFGAYSNRPNYHARTPVGAASSRDRLISRLEAAPTNNSTCSFQITAYFFLRFLVREDIVMGMAAKIQTKK
jgi:hypothetical protein